MKKHNDKGLEVVIKLLKEEIAFIVSPHKEILKTNEMNMCFTCIDIIKEIYDESFYKKDNYYIDESNIKWVCVDEKHTTKDGVLKIIYMFEKDNSND